ncbi:MAG: hypothetical protein KF838_05310 [Phycisphaeraceae bacterium]|nr:MAG: hypothetical protein KF838_05310 [Phycisphaeraceae bacterium]
MVASSATTPVGGTALQSGDSATALCPSAPSSALHSDSSFPTLSLSHSVTLSLLNDLTSPHHSLASVAEKHNLTLDALLIWLAQPDTREAISLREHAAYTHVRLVAAVNLSHAVHATVRTLEHFVATPRPADPLDPTCLRAAIHARKAAWLLSRFSRIVPINASRATPLKVDGPMGSQRTASVSQRTTVSDSSLRSQTVDNQTVDPSGALPDPPPASSPHDVTDSPRAPLVPGSDPKCHTPEPTLQTTGPHRASALPPSAPSNSPFDNVPSRKTPSFNNPRTNKRRAPLQAATLVAAAGSIDST